MVQRNTGVVGHYMEHSLSTRTCIGNQQEIAGAFLVHHHGTSTATLRERWHRLEITPETAQAGVQLRGADERQR